MEYTGEFGGEKELFNGKGKLSRFNEDGYLEIIQEGTFTENEFLKDREFTETIYLEGQKLKVWLSGDKGGIRETIFYQVNTSSGVRTYQNVTFDSHNLNTPKEILGQKLWQKGESAGVHEKNFDFFKSYIFYSIN